MNSVTKAIHDIARCQMRHRAGYMEQFGLKGCHASYLMALCEEPGISQEQLARRLYANKSNIARQLAVLEENGYVRRETDAADKRIQRVYPAEKALALLPLIQEKQAEWDSFITNDLTKEELDLARMVLRKMKQKADAFTERENEWKN